MFASLPCRDGSWSDVGLGRGVLHSALLINIVIVYVLSFPALFIAGVLKSEFLFFFILAVTLGQEGTLVCVVGLAVARRLSPGLSSNKLVSNLVSVNVVVCVGQAAYG